MLDSFGDEFRSSQTKMAWKHLRVIYAHDSLHHLLPVEGGSACVYVQFILLMCTHIIEVSVLLKLFCELHAKNYH